MSSVGALMASLVAAVSMLMWETGHFSLLHVDGSSMRSQFRLRADKGFSLIEVLVVLVVLASVIVVSTLSLQGLQSRGLTLEAERLGARIHAAQDEARLLAQAIRLELDDRGYRFYRNQLGRWQLIEGDELLKPRAWEAFTEWRTDSIALRQYPGGVDVAKGVDVKGADVKGADVKGADVRGGVAEGAVASPSFFLAIGAEPIGSPWSLMLWRAGQGVSLQSDGLGPIKYRTL
ncbi:MAG: prepilin-type N-terminal cleavage/methylation domain-containing protein [Betaproteobacteria bacterium]